MKIPVAIFFLFSFTVAGGQSRIYISGGFTTSSGGNFVTFSAKETTFPSVNLEWEKKMIGSISLLTGISAFGVGYSTDNSAFGSQSTFKANYLAVPLLIRWNIMNKNAFYFDFGFQPYYLMKAHLQESIIKFGDVRSAEGDITPYLNRLFASAKFQETFAFNRFAISIFFIFPFKGQSSVKNLQDHWTFNQQQSTYLLSNGYSDFFILGLTLGVRLK